MGVLAVPTIGALQSSAAAAQTVTITEYRAGLPADAHPGSIVTGPDGLSFETNGHVRFCVRTPGENDLLLTTLHEVMRSRPTV